MPESPQPKAMTINIPPEMVNVFGAVLQIVTAVACHDKKAVADGCSMMHDFICGKIEPDTLNPWVFECYSKINEALEGVPGYVSSLDATGGIGLPISQPEIKS